MKRFVFAAVAAAIGGIVAIGPVGANTPPPDHPGAHQHHVHNEHGCQDIGTPMGGGGIHNATNRDNHSHADMHHGSCAAHSPQP